MTNDVSYPPMGKGLYPWQGNVILVILSIVLSIWSFSLGNILFGISFTVLALLQEFLAIVKYDVEKERKKEKDKDEE
jgi:hypothetical protein